MRTLIAFMFSMMLSACSTTSSLSQLGQDMRAFNAQVRVDHDKQTANIVRHSQGPLSYRAATLADKPETLSAMTSACEQGRYVELIAYAGALREASALKGSCVQVFISDNPDLNRRVDMLMVDSRRLVTKGEYARASETDLRQEYGYKMFVKQTAHRIN